MHSINFLKQMKPIFITIIFLSLFYNFDKKTNKDVYNVTSGEKIEIYFSTNSCCYYCISNKEELDNVKFIEQKVIELGDKNCVGCNYKGAFVFIAESIGSDTIKIQNVTANTKCDSSELGIEKYIINVH